MKTTFIFVVPFQSVESPCSVQHVVETWEARPGVYYFLEAEKRQGHLKMTSVCLSVCMRLLPSSTTHAVCVILQDSVHVYFYGVSIY
jgi:hypothetical protein